MENIENVDWTEFPLAVLTLSKELVWLKHFAFKYFCEKLFQKLVEAIIE